MKEKEVVAFLDEMRRQWQCIDRGTTAMPPITDNQLEAFFKYSANRPKQEMSLSKLPPVPSHRRAFYPYTVAACIVALLLSGIGLLYKFHYTVPAVQYAMQNPITEPIGLNEDILVQYAASRTSESKPAEITPPSKEPSAMVLHQYTPTPVTHSPSDNNPVEEILCDDILFHSKDSYETMLCNTVVCDTFENLFYLHDHIKYLT